MAESETQATAPEKKRKARKKNLEITLFDRSVAKEVMNGVSSVASLKEKFKSVDETEFDARLRELSAEGYFALNGDVVKFGIKGFNAFAPKPKKEKAKAVAPAVQAKTKEETQVSPAASIAPESPAQKTDERMDLDEAFRKGAPSGTGDSFFAKRRKQREGAAAEAAAAAPIQPLKNGEEGACELCKAPFKISTGAENNPRYGHCFCGAAYHQDCYETLAATGANCVRCGKKIKLTVDRRTEEAMKGVKDAFD
ncbi:Uncharacterised protein [Candidatus Norongarragalina meridionalis]|nr:Uncharacterised protein [Candidatus Norongarragalina meridionalis]